MFTTSKTKNQELRENVRKWIRSIQRQMRKLDRDIEGIKREEDKVYRDMKKMKDAKQTALRILCK